MKTILFTPIATMWLAYRAQAQTTTRMHRNVRARQSEKKKHKRHRRHTDRSLAVNGGNCSRDTCTVYVLNNDACDDNGDCYTCGERIAWLMSHDGGHYSEENACAIVAGEEFTDECGLCNPQTPLLSTSSITDDATDTLTAQCSSHPLCAHLTGDCCPTTPGGMFLSCCETQNTVPPPAPVPPDDTTSNSRLSPSAQCSSHSACAHLNGDCCPTTPGGMFLDCCETENTSTNIPIIPTDDDYSGAPPIIPDDDDSSRITGQNCGCDECTDTIWNAQVCDNNGCYTCGERISWLMSAEGGSKTLEFSCNRVANDFYDTCGSCNPNICNPVYVPDPNPSELVWSDEFDSGSIPDNTKWDYDIGGNGWGNGELQHYTNRANNAYISGGVLQIKAVKESYGGNQYTSARLVSKNKGDWKYGRVAVRARLSQCTGRGTWAAIWMLPSDGCYGIWPTSGEIDIMEHVGYDTNRVHGTVHTGSFNHMIGTQVGSSIQLDVSEYHTYETIWSEDKIEFIVDGIKYHEFVRDSSPTVGEWPFDQRFHVILNVAVGGAWGGFKGVDSGAFEGNGQIMEVDYVRVYSTAPPAVPGCS